MSILERRKTKAVNLVLAAPVAALTLTGLTAQKAQAQTAISPSDILVFQGGSAATGDSIGLGGGSIYIQELNTTTASQTPVQTFNITNLSTTQYGADNGLYTNNNGSNGILSLSNNGSVVTFGAYVGNNSSNELTQNVRDAATLDANGNFTEAATYNELSTAPGNGQIRSAYTPDGTNWYFGDKDGVYLANSTTWANNTNIRSIKGFGGTTYALSQNTTDALNTVSSDGTTLTGVTGIPTLSKATDFVMLESGVNGSTYDSLYISGNNEISKYAYNTSSSSWAAEGTIAALGIADITGTELTSNDTGAELYYTTTTGAYSIADNSAYNATAVGGTATQLYAAPTGSNLFGISLAPTATPEPASLSLLGLGCAALIGRRRRRVGT